jgi:WD40 repeat protein
MDRIPYSGSVQAVATPDGRRAVSTSGDQTVRLWDLESYQTLRIFQGHKGLVQTVEVAPDGLTANASDFETFAALAGIKIVAYS